MMIHTKHVSERCSKGSRVDARVDVDGVGRTAVEQIRRVFEVNLGIIFVISP